MITLELDQSKEILMSWPLVQIVNVFEIN